MNIERYVDRYLRNLARYARMYAQTQGEFIVKVEMLLGLVGVKEIEAYPGHVFLREGSCSVDYGVELTDVFALRVVAHCRKVIDALPRCTTCGRIAADDSVCSSAFHLCRDCEWKNGVLQKECFLHNSEPKWDDSGRTLDELAADIETIIAAEVAELLSYKNIRVLSIVPGVYGTKRSPREVVVQRVTTAVSNRYKDGVCKICGGSAWHCVPKHAKGEGCSSPPKGIPQS